jgi:hypothetical protein
VSQDLIVLVLFALAGFLVGGAFSTWKRSRVMAVLLGAAAVLAGGGGALWLAG